MKAELNVPLVNAGNKVPVSRGGGLRSQERSAPGSCFAEEGEGAVSLVPVRFLPDPGLPESAL